MSSIMTCVSAPTEAIKNRATSAGSIFKGNIDKEGEGVQTTYSVNRVVTLISPIHHCFTTCDHESDAEAQNRWGLIGGLSDVDLLWSPLCLSAVSVVL